MEQHMYAIGEVAKLTGVPIRTIRYYALIGLLPPAATTDARYRLYTAREIWRLQLIRSLRAFGFGLDDIGKLLAGDVSTVAMIRMQLQVVREQIAQLTRVERVLEHAHANTATGDALRFMHELGTALHDDAVERRRLLVAKLRAATPHTEPALSAWQETFLQNIAEQLPATMTTDQAATWAELVALINDPAFGAALRDQVGAAEHISEGDARDRGEQMRAVLERAAEVLEAGAAPNSAEVQALAHQWLDVFAKMYGQPHTPKFVRWFVWHAPQVMPDEIERFWTLLVRLQGQRDAPSHFAAQRFLLEAVQWRAEQIANEDVVEHDE